MGVATPTTEESRMVAAAPLRRNEVLIVTVEIKSARTGERKTLGQMRISNKGDSANPNRGNYWVQVIKRGQDAESANSKVVRRGEVLNYPRNAYSIWRLVLKALRASYPEDRG